MRQTNSNVEVKLYVKIAHIHFSQIQSQKIRKQFKYMGARQIKVTNLIAKMMHEESEDTKGVITLGILKKNRQHNGHNKKFNRINNDLQNIHIKLKIE